MTLKRLTPALILAGLLLAVAGGLNMAADAGLVGDDLTRRGVQVVIGLVLAGYGNLMPKQIGRWRDGAADARVQKVLRVGGWSMTAAGLVHAGLWAFAPLTFADTAAMVVVATALVVTLGFAVWSFAVCRTTDAGPARP